jgi:hypothetical protein
MKTTIGIYDSHKKAIDAIEVLQKSGYPVSQLSLIGKADLIDDHMHLTSNELLKDVPVSIGAVAGPVLGILTGIGIFAIPGLGFLFGAGALVGAIAGFDFGLVGGGIVTLIATLGIHKDYAIKYDEHLKANKFLVIAQGNETEVDKAKDILSSHGQQIEIHCH